MKYVFFKWEIVVKKNSFAGRTPWNAENASFNVASQAAH
jgi:hypothetical protein